MVRNKTSQGNSPLLVLNNLLEIIIYAKKCLLFKLKKIEEIKSNKTYTFWLACEIIYKLKKKLWKLMKNWSSYEVLSFKIVSNEWHPHERWLEK